MLGGSNRDSHPYTYRLRIGTLVGSTPYEQQQHDIVRGRRLRHSRISAAYFIRML